MSALDDRLARSAHLSQVCVGILSKRSVNDIADARDRLTMKATDYVAELHRSQLLLLNYLHFASAAAMMRLIMEGALSALYVLHLKNEEQALRLEQGAAYLPGAGKMFARCAKLPVIGHHIYTIGNSQSPFHKFTHGDMPQINRRGHPGEWSEAFDQTEIIKFSILSDFVFLGTMDTYSHAVADPGMRKAIRAVRDENAVEARAFGLQILEDDTFSPVPSRGPPGGADEGSNANA